MSWKSGARAIDKLERTTVVAGTLKQELLKRQYVVFGSECVKFTVQPYGGQNTGPKLVVLCTNLCENI
jgi:hypothetical protein